MVVTPCSILCYVLSDWFCPSVYLSDYETKQILVKDSLIVHRSSKSCELVIEERLHTLKVPMQSTISTIPLLSYYLFIIDFSVSYALHNNYL